MAWSDAARAAALEVRRRNNTFHRYSKSKASSLVYNYKKADRDKMTTPKYRDTIAKALRAARRGSFGRASTGALIQRAAVSTHLRNWMIKTANQRYVRRGIALMPSGSIKIR